MSGSVEFCRGSQMSSEEGDYLGLGLDGMTHGQVFVFPWCDQFGIGGRVQDNCGEGYWGLQSVY